MAQLGKSEKTLVLIISNGIVYSVALIVPVVLVRYLSKVDYGTYSQTFMVGRIVYASFLFGIIPSIYHYYPLLKEEKQKTFLFQSVMVMTLLGVMACLFLLAGADFIGRQFNNPDLPEMLKIYAIYTFCLIASDYYIPLLIAQGGYKKSLVLRSAESIVKIIFLFTPLIFGYGIKALMISVAVYAFFRFSIYSVANYVNNMRHSNCANWDKELIKDQVSFSAPLGLMYLVAIAGQYLDKLIISTYLTPLEYGIYAIGAIEIPLGSVIQGATTTVLRTEIPKLVKDNHLEEARTIWRESVRKQALIMLPFFCYFLINAHDLIVFAFTESYQKSAEIFLIYLFLIPAQIASFSVVPLAFKKTKFNLLMSLVSLPISSLLAITLFQVIGMKGPAIAMVTAYYVTTFFYLLYTEKLIKSPPFRLFPLVVVLKILLCSVIPCLLTRYLFHDYFASFMPYLLVTVSFCLVIYFFLIYKFNLLSVWDRTLLKRLFSNLSILFTRRSIESAKR